MSGAAQVRQVEPGQAGVVPEPLRSFPDRDVPQLLPGVHVVGGERLEERTVHRQPVDLSRELGGSARRPGRYRRARRGSVPLPAPPGLGRQAGQPARLVDAVGGHHEARRAAGPAVRCVQDPGRRVGHRRLVDVEPAHTADHVPVVVVVRIRQRRHVQPPDPELAQDLHRLALQLRREVEYVVLRQPIDHDRVEWFGPGRIRLGGGRVVARNLGLHHRTLLNRPDRLAGGSVESEDQPLLGVLDERRHARAVHGQVHQDRCRRYVVVPLIAAVDLKVPPPLSGRHVEGQDAAAEQVVSRPMARVRLNGRGIRHQVDEPECRIGRGRSPGRHVARPAPGVVLPGFVTVFAGSGDDVELPEHLAGAGIDAQDVPRHVLDAGLVVARFVTHQYHDHPVDDDRGRRGGNHSQLLGNAVIRVIGAVPGQPRTPVGHQGRDEVDNPVRREGADVDRFSPALQRSPRLGVQRPEKEGGRRDEDDAPAVDFGVGDTLAEVGARRATVAHRLRLAEGPEGLTRRGVDRHHLPPLAGDGVEHAIDEYRRGPHRVLDTGPEVVAAPDPGNLEVGEVLGVDLGEPGIGAGVAGVAAQITPLAVFQPRRLRRGQGNQPEQAGQ